MTVRHLILTSLWVVGLTSAAHGQIVLGQNDTFQDGTLQNWQNNAGNASNVGSGGPGGASDNFMSITSDGGMAGGRLTAYNVDQWLGNYIAAGVTSIEMDFKVFSAASLSMRISLNTGISSSANGYVSTDAAVIPADNAWHHAVFLLDATNLTAVNTPPALASVLAGPAELRIVQSLLPNTIHGNFIVASIGVDNIQATSVPEPGSFALCGLALTGAFGTYRRRYRRKTDLGS